MTLPVAASSPPPVRPPFLHGLMRPALLVFAANLTRTGCGFLVTLVAARALGPAEFGYFSTFVALAVLAYALLGEGFDPGIVRLYARRQAERPGDLHALGGVLGAAVLLRVVLAVPMLAVLAAATLWLLPDGPDGTVPLAALAAIFTSAFMLTLAVLQGSERYILLAGMMPVANLLRLLAAVALWVSKAITVLALMWTQVLALLVAAVVAAWKLRSLWRHVHLDRPAFRELLRFGSWSSLASACFVLAAYLPIPALTHAVGPAAGGVYAAAATVMLIVDQLTASILAAKLVPSSRIDSLSGLRGFIRQMLPRLLLLGGILALMYPLSYVVFPLLFGSGYESAASVMRVLLPGYLATLLSHPLYLVLYSTDQPQQYAASGVILLLSFAVLALLLVPEGGAFGMACATTGARCVQALSIVAMVWLAVRQPAALSHSSDAPHEPHQPR